jgi:hypothetical protein
MVRRPRFSWLLVAALLLTCGPAAALAADEVRIGGVDPTKEPVVATFSCYAEVAGDQYTQPSSVLQILPGRRYVLGGQEGTFTVDPNETLSITWQTGPLASAPYASSVLFGDWGQRISITPPADQPSSNCYQQGAREQLAKQEFQIRDPGTAAYACVEDATKAAAPALEFLPGRTYRFSGASGTYAIDLLRAQDETSATITFTAGPLLDRNAFSSGDAKTGLRTVNVYGTPKLKCTVLGPPLIPARYGPGKVGRGPKGLPLEGTYAHYEIDVLGYCGGFCWTFYTFTDTGRVYTRNPEASLGEAACTRRLPNGLPVCPTYRLGRRSLQIGNEPAQPVRTTGRGITIGKDAYRKVAPLTAKRLRGEYISNTYLTTPGVGSVFAQRKFTFAGDGAFTREGFVGGVVTNPSGGSAGVLPPGESSNPGTYAIEGNTLTLRYTNGAVSRLFVWAWSGDGNRAHPKSLRIGTSDYVPQ